MKDPEALLEAVKSAAANYSYEENDMDFEAIVKIKCEDGWCYTSLANEKDNKQ